MKYNCTINNKMKIAQSPKTLKRLSEKTRLVVKYHHKSSSSHQIYNARYCGAGRNNY